MQKLVPRLPQPALPLHGETPQGQQHATACHRVQILPESCGVFFVDRRPLKQGCDRGCLIQVRQRSGTESREQKDVKNKQKIFRTWNVLDRAGTKREKRQTRGAACPDPCRKHCGLSAERRTDQSCRKALRAFAAAGNAARTTRRFCTRRPNGDRGL